MGQKWVIFRGEGFIVMRGSSFVAGGVLLIDSLLCNTKLIQDKRVVERLVL